MGCVKSSGTIKISTNSGKNKINEMEQKKLISTYVSSSDCGESDALSKLSSLNNSGISKNNNIFIKKNSKIEEEKN